MEGTLTLDIETHEAGLLYTMPPERFVRLIGYRWNGRGEVVLTTSLDEIREQILRARYIIGHNIHSFDLPAIFGVDSDIPVQLAHDRRVIDTWTHAALVHPAPYESVDRNGKPYTYDKPEKLKHWFGLDEQAYQLGVTGKTHDLKELAYEFGDPDLPKKEREKDGFGKIPLNDQRYRDYLVGDVIASEEVSKALLRLGPLDDYAWREQEIEARKAVIQANGIRLDIPRATARRDELAARKAVILSELEEQYGLPTVGDAPWDTTAGKKAIMSALADRGITPDTVNWPKTPTWDKRGEKEVESLSKASILEAKALEWEEELNRGELPPRSVAARGNWIVRDRAKAAELRANPLPPAFGLSLGGKELKAITAGTAAEELGQALAELKGQRSLSQLALDSVHSDGFCHPQITMLQKSGRWSTTEPGLTIWTNKGPGAIEKAYFLPDSDDDVLVEFDLSNADARAVAAMSGDERYAERFLPGADGHLINAWAAWGKEKVGTDKHDPETARFRDLAKPGGHGWGYRIGAKKLAATWGLPIEEARKFLNNMNKAFRKVVAWQDKAVDFARKCGCVVNEWGRRMPVDKGREYTQGPALLGQSTTREIICDAILAMPLPVLRRLKIQVHDALVMSLPKASLDRSVPYICDLMKTTLHPKGGQLIEFPADHGPAGANWFEARH